MKIYIIGGPGSGKTHLASKIGSYFNIEHIELDKILWKDNFKSRISSFDLKTNVENIVQSKKNWIIEGTYYKNLENIFLNADIIVVLKTNLFIRGLRIISRFFYDKRHNQK